MNLQILSLFFVIVLVACSKETDRQADLDTSSPASPVGEEKVKPLNLSVPAIPENEQPHTFSEEKAKLPDLFNQEKEEKRLSVSGSPALKPGDDLLEAPEVVGGKVSIEVTID